MSHFTVMVALDKSVDLSYDAEGKQPALEFALDQVLERFNENREVEPYREYQDGGPEDYWWVSKARTERQHYADGTGLKEYDPKFIGWGSNISNQTFEQQRTEQLAWKKWADLLDAYETEFEGLRWLDVIKLYEAWKRQTGDHSEEIFYDEEKDQVYTLNTYNPQSKWDWWVIGGRWAGKFHPTPEYSTEKVLLAKLDRWNSPKYEDTEVRIDGGRVRYIDFERKRNEAGAEAMALHRKYHALFAEYGAGFKYWSHYLGLVEAKEITIDEARRFYREQPFKKALNETEEFRFYWGNMEEDLGVPEEEYVETARRGSTTGYSFITKAGVWMEPGEMHMFGISTDTPSSREAYDVEVNTYLNNLDPDDIVVVLDCHI